MQDWRGMILGVLSSKYCCKPIHNPEKLAIFACEILFLLFDRILLKIMQTYSHIKPEKMKSLGHLK